MSNINPIGYCNQCGQKVLMRRKELNIVLAIFLFIFGFFGFIIYLIIHYSQEEDRCVHCGNICQKVLPYDSDEGKPQIEYQSPIITGKKPKFCPLCGEKLDERNLEFCPNCGTDLNKS